MSEASHPAIPARIDVDALNRASLELISEHFRASNTRAAYRSAWQRSLDTYHTATFALRLKQRVRCESGQEKHRL